MKTTNSKILLGCIIISCLSMGSCVLAGCDTNGKYDTGSDEGPGHASDEMYYGNGNDSTINKNIDSTLNPNGDSTHLNPQKP